MQTPITLEIGFLIFIATLIIGVTIFYTSVILGRKDIKEIKTEMFTVKHEIVKISTEVVKISTEVNKINSINERIQDRLLFVERHINDKKNT